MAKLLLVALGGALGTLARYGVNSLAHEKYTGLFPLATLTVNLTGSFIIGLVWGITSGLNINQNLVAFLSIGVLGGFTTFSSYSLETLNLLRVGDYKLALYSVLLNNVAGILLAFLGFMLAKQVLQYYGK
ncbi:MAG: fluoride efflux transporter CrcB [Cyclobacteriaceae bacterium]|nr:fluoride efflux transporter CrcB [Cyclobacteriaceae bacterium]